jgi:hypothetical protein
MLHHHTSLYTLSHFMNSLVRELPDVMVHSSSSRDHSTKNSHEAYGDNVALQISKDRIQQSCAADLPDAWVRYEPIMLTVEHRG